MTMTTIPQKTGLYDVFDYLKKEMLWDSREPRLAIYVDDNPEELTEYWHLVDASPSGYPHYQHMIAPYEETGYRVRPVHRTVPLSQIDTEKPILDARYGSSTIIGLTSFIPPHLLGVKRYGLEDEAENLFTKMLFSDRNNYKIKMYNNGLKILKTPLGFENTPVKILYADMDRRDEALEMLTENVNRIVDTMTDEEYDMKIEQFMKNNKEVNAPISYDEAFERAMPFWASSIEQEKVEIDFSVARSNSLKSVFKQYRFDHMQF